MAFNGSVSGMDQPIVWTLNSPPFPSGGTIYIFDGIFSSKIDFLMARSLLI
jgi:hypothetical protein